MYAVQVKIDGEWVTGACRHVAIGEANALLHSFQADGHEARLVCVDSIGREL